MWSKSVEAWSWYSASSGLSYMTIFHRVLSLKFYSWAATSLEWAITYMDRELTYTREGEHKIGRGKRLFVKINITEADFTTMVI